ncbi:MAG TPA: sigma 54-interacting transcriptional regulator [Terrimicrobium sp.]
MSEELKPMGDEAALRLVVEGTAAETGKEFFRALVKNLATVTGTAGAWVTEYFQSEHRLRAHAFWLNGAFVDHFEYDIAGTACAPVVESKKLVHIPERLIELYPHDPDVVALNAVSYLGVPLLDTEGEVMGHLSVLDTKPMPPESRMISLFQIFAARAAAEQRRLKVEQQVRAREEELSALLQSAMDAIVVLDNQMKIVRVNPAADRLFGCTAEDLVGESINDFLIPESATRVEAFAKEICGRPDGRQQLWVPQDFIVRRWDHSVFPAEATLSRFKNRNEVFYTLILRNSDERLEAERQIQLLTQETEYLRDAVREMPGHDDLLGRSDCMQAVFDAIKRVAKTDCTVLITGETGTGKELVARSIHRASDRADKPLVLVNCAAIPANLIESEFFGHERGAFTGAVSRREGRFSLANAGTIFLDEVGELPLELQAKLLRVLQEGEFEPLGSPKTVKVDVRVVAATNRDLKQMAAEGKFREDLYFRLYVFPVHIPPLRERGRDVEHLAAAFIQRFARRMGKRIYPLNDDQLKRLKGYDWPGNVRELQNVIERAIILTSGNQLELERAMSGIAAPKPDPSPISSEPISRVYTAREMENLERSNIMRALASCDGKVSGECGAARLLGIPATTLNSRMKALGIQRSQS